METPLVGAKGPYYIQAAVTTGTLTITGTPQWSLRKKVDGSIVTDWTNISQGTTGGWDVAAQATVKAWYTLDTSALTTGLTYVLALKMSVVASSDNITRVAETTHEILIEPVVTVGQSTYDISTDIGKVRYLVNDRDVTDPRNTDPEYQFCLDQSGGNLYIAAAMSLEADLALLAIGSGKVQLSVFGTDDREVVDNVNKVIARLRAKGMALPVIGTNIPDPIFTVDSNDGTFVGSTHRW